MDKKKDIKRDTTVNEENPRLIRFDWAMKRLLRDKANFAVLEGFLTTLIGEKIKIQELLESEANTDRSDGKLNRVDILAKDSKGRKMLIEVQNQSENAFFHRMLFGTSKLVVDYINKGEPYDKIDKIYSISLVYFKMEGCKDSVYRGTTQFFGLHTGEELDMGDHWREKYEAKGIADIYPEYFLLLAYDFDKWSKTHIDQWMYFLSQGIVHEGSDAPGLAEAKEKLRIDSMPKAERDAYYRHLDDVTSMNHIVADAKEEGIFYGERKGLKIGLKQGLKQGLEQGMKQGMKQGLEQGREEGKLEERQKMILGMLAANVEPSVIASITGLSIEEISALQ